MEYKTLTAEDRRAIAWDALRGFESDHYRLSKTILPSQQPGVEQRLSELTDQINLLKTEVEALDTEIEGQKAKA